ATPKLFTTLAQASSSNQSTLAGVTLTRRKRSVKRLNFVAFRSSTACLKLSGVNLRVPQTSQERLSPLPPVAWNTRPSNGNCSIFSIFSRMNLVSGSSQPHSMSFFLWAPVWAWAIELPTTKSRTAVALTIVFMPVLLHVSSFHISSTIGLLPHVGTQDSEAAD